jgi:kynureninase
MAVTQADADGLDASDPLASYRSEFFRGGQAGDIDRDINGGGRDDDEAYLCGNSLGRLPHATIERLSDEVAREWGTALVQGWDRWTDLPTIVGDLIGVEILGARPGETVVADSTTVNFYKLAVGALRARPRGVVLTDASNFPTDRYVLQGLDREIRLLAAEAPDDAVIDALQSGDVALVTLSHVSYRSGVRRDLPAITLAAHDAGALVLWDLSHSAGAIGIDLAVNDVDLAVGCTYKYLNGGPGSPAFLYVASRLQHDLSQPIQGWFGAKDIFAMGPAYEPAPSSTKFLSGTPSILGLAAVEEGARITARAGIDAIERKAASITTFLIECLDEAGADVVTPRDAHRRGAHVAIRDPLARERCDALAAQRVIADVRAPDIIRFGLSPLYTRYQDAWRAAHVLSTMKDGSR